MKNIYTVEAEEKLVYKPEITTCPICGEKLVYRHCVSNKIVMTLSGAYQIINLGYGCPDKNCKGYDVVYSSEEAFHQSLWYTRYGMDVFAFIGEQRFCNHKTRMEIAEELKQYNVQMTDREVEKMYEKYEQLLKTDSTERQNETYQTCKVRYGGIVLSLDGIQPAKGNETLYVLREVLSGKVIASISMKNGSSKELKEALESYVDTDVPILGFISDGQRSIRKALKELRPDVPYQFCQFHYLKDISKPMVESDRKLKTTIKKNLRGLRAIEVSIKQNEQLEEKEKEIINGYCEAIRSILLEDGKPPLELPGMKIYEKLEELKKSLEHSLEMVEQKKEAFSIS